MKTTVLWPTIRTGGSPLRWLLGACVSIALGCGNLGQGPVELSAPSLESSKAALVASLDGWKAGRRVSGVLIGSKPSIGVVDSTRTVRPLLGYEVIGPLLVVGKARPFAVRLNLDAPRETVSARYVVLGRDPLWVFRQEDFERMLHWEHDMGGASEDEPSKTPAGKPASVVP